MGRFSNFNKPNTVTRLTQTERSHEENQERAYIAASRRTDRSIEARVQSARMASEVHKKRTGKCLKVSEESVVKEEMYEEEEDLPCQYQALAGHLQTSSTGVGCRTSAYLTSRIAIESHAHQQEVNRLFAEQFPHAEQVSRQLSQSAYYQQLQINTAGQGSLTSPDFAQMGLAASKTAFHRDRSISIPHATTEISSRRPSTTPDTPPPSRHQGSIDDTPSPTLTPSSGPTAIMQPYLTLTFAQAQATCPIDPLLSAFSTMPMSSSFTAELPTEAKMLASLINNPADDVFLGCELTGSEGLEFPNYIQASDDTCTIDLETAKQECTPPLEEDPLNGMEQQLIIKPLEISGQQSGIGTSDDDLGDAWDS